MFDEEEDDSSPLNGYWMEGDSLAPPCQADLDVVDSILLLCAPTHDSCLYDLGCGDGRICIQASLKYGCRAVGCEIEEKLILKFNNHNIRNGTSDKVQIIHGDLRQIDLSDATVIVIYLLPDAVEEIKPKLIEALLRGVVLVCNTWGPKDLIPSLKITCGPLNNVCLLKYDRSSVPII